MGKGENLEIDITIFPSSLANPTEVTEETEIKGMYSWERAKERRLQITEPHGIPSTQGSDEKWMPHSPRKAAWQCRSFGVMW